METVLDANVGTDQTAQLEIWLTRHKGLLFKVVHSYSNSRAEADDLFQELCLQLWKSIPNFSGQCSESTWIYKVALFSAISWTRRETKHRQTEFSDDLDLTLAENAQPDPRLTWLYEQIKSFNAVDRSLCLLMLEGYQYREIADILGITSTHVGVKLNRIKQALSKKREEEFTHGV